MSRPLTARQFQQILKYTPSDESMYYVGRDDMQRIEDTIKAGGFTPEPLREPTLKEWLWRDRPGDWHRPFEVFDLGRALVIARMEGIHPTLDAAAKSTWILMVEGRTYRFNDLCGVARHLTALAYKAGNPTANVAHLLGNQGDSDDGH